jgi:hypothetical protein
MPEISGREARSFHFQHVVVPKAKQEIGNRQKEFWTAGHTESRAVSLNLVV